MIFELNEQYLGRSVLPRLVTEYLNPLEANYDVSVNAGTDGGSPSEPAAITRR
jgi:hypothetical protein